MVTIGSQAELMMLLTSGTVNFHFPMMKID